jgi:hypothetical protein
MWGWEQLYFNIKDGFLGMICVDEYQGCVQLLCAAQVLQQSNPCMPVLQRPLFVGTGVACSPSQTTTTLRSARL